MIATIALILFKILVGIILLLAVWVLVGSLNALFTKVMADVNARRLGDANDDD